MTLDEFLRLRVRQIVREELHGQTDSATLDEFEKAVGAVLAGETDA